MLLAAALSIAVGLNAQWQETVTLTCGASISQICSVACGNRARCEWVQSSCVGCSGASDPSLFAIYRSIPSIRASNIQSLGPFFQDLQESSWILFHPRSPYNFFSSPDEPEYANSLNTACKRASPGSQGISVVGTRRSVDRPWEASYIVCSHPRHGSQVFAVIQSPDASRTSSR